MQLKTYFLILILISTYEKILFCIKNTYRCSKKDVTTLIGCHKSVALSTDFSFSGYIWGRFKNDAGFQNWASANKIKPVRTCQPERT